MKRTIAVFMCLIAPLIIYAQKNEQTEISGKLIAVDNDVEGVTIFNMSSKIGTVSNAKGEFVIKAALNDRLQISALQFQTFTVRINETIIESQILNLVPVERINALNEVIILPSRLTGNLTVDTESIELAPMMKLNFGNLSDMEFPEDRFTKVDNTLMKKGQLYNGVDFARILGLNRLINRRK